MVQESPQLGVNQVLLRGFFGRPARLVAAAVLLLGVVVSSTQPVSATAVPQAVLVVVPSAPRNISVAASQRTLTLSFSAPAVGASGVTGYQVQRSTNGSTWTTVSNGVASNATSYAITGLESNTLYYVRIAAKYSGGLGAWGYNWQKMYEVTSPTRDSSGNIQYLSGFGIGASDAAQTNEGVAFTRVRYRMAATYSSTNNYVDANFSRTLGTATTYSESFSSLARLRVPTTTSTGNATFSSPNHFEIHANVSDLDVESNVANVQNGSGFDGRLEIWPWNYAVGAATGLAARTVNTYDDSDTPDITATSGSTYGSFQLHRLSATSGENRTIFAWNRHSNGQTPDIGFGNNLNTLGHSDWTFEQASVAGGGTRTNFNLQIFVDVPVRTPVSTGRTGFTSSGTNYVVERFTSGSSTWTVPQGVTAIDLLVIGGGGGGKSRHGGGGGAGGFATATNYAVTPGTTYNIAVGLGGAGGSAGTATAGSNGSASSFLLGGVGVTANGGDGGTGNGGTSGTSTGTGITSFSNAGGNALNGTCGNSDWCGGGGGGAGAAGSNADSTSPSRGGNGGLGRTSSITGVLVTYAGGGGGSSGDSTSAGFSGTATGGGSGGSGVGGAGGTASPISNCTTSTAGGTGAANTGSGGGGGGYCNRAASGGGDFTAAGGAGGSGIVIVRYEMPRVSAPDLDAASDSGSSSTDNVTTATNLTFSGTAPVGATVQLSTAASGTSPSTGSWTNRGSACTADATTGAWSCSTGSLTAGTTYAVRAVATVAIDGLSTTQTSATSLDVTVNSQTALAGDTSLIPGTTTGTNYIVERFTGVGSTTWTVPQGVTSVDVVVVGGGGGGAARHGGGGGAGRFISETGWAVTPGDVIDVVVGAGGAPGLGSANFGGTAGSNGELSRFGSLASGLVAYGGEGGQRNTSPMLAGGRSGGTSSGTFGNAGGTGISDACPTGQTTWCGGGGAGDGGVGGNASGTGNGRGGNGGAGRASTITGATVLYAGGGGGGGGAGEGKPSAPGGSAAARGGNGGATNVATGSTDCTTPTAGQDADPNSGSGGGGGGYCNNAGSGIESSGSGGAGGSGIVLVRYALPAVSPPDLAAVSDSGSSNTDNITSTTNLTFTGTAPVGASVQLSTAAAGTEPSSGTWTNRGSTCTANATTGAWSCTTGTLAEGTYAVRAVATVAVDGVTATQTSSTALDIRIDTTAPVSSATITPSHFKGASFFVNFTASDAGGLAALTVFRSTNSNLSSPVSCLGPAWDSVQTSASGGISCTGITDPDTTYYVYTRATDLAGNTEAVPGSADDSVVRDSVLPSSSASITPSLINGTSVTVGYSASDAAKLEKVEVFRSTNSNLSSAESCGEATGLSGTTANGTVTCTGLSTDGTYYVYTLATDAAGNVEAAPTSADDSVDRDGTKPVVTSLTPPSSPSLSRSLSYSLSFDESVSGLATVDFEVVTVPVSSSCSVSGVSGSAGSSFTVSVTCTADRDVVLTLKAGSVSDAAGNTGPASAVSASSVTVQATLTVSLDSKGGSAVPGVTTLVGGSVASSPGTPVLAGYTFLGWSATDGGLPVTFPWTHGRTEDFTLFAVWEAASLTVSFSSRGGTLVPDEVDFTETGGSIAEDDLPADPSRTGFNFLGWAESLDDAADGIVIDFNPSWEHDQTEDFTLYAVWEAKPIVVTLDPMGGVFAEGVDTTIDTETGALLANPPTPTREGFVFDGWTTVIPSSPGFPVRFSPLTEAAQRLTSLSVASASPTLVWPHNRRSDFTLYALWREATSPRNVWFYPGGAPSNVFLVSVSSLSTPEWSPIDDTMLPGFPRSTEIYRVTARIAVPNGIGQLSTVTMCWYKSQGDDDPDDGVSSSCADADTRPQTEFEVVWDQLGDEFSKTGSNNYQVQDTSGFDDSIDGTVTGTVVEVYFDFKISNAMRAGNWTVKVTALDVSGEVRDETAYVDVATFVQMQVGTGRTQQNFGTLAENSSSEINDMAVGSYTANTDADFTIEGTNFETTDDRVITLLATDDDPGVAEAALDCSIGTTLTSPQRVTTSPVAMSANLPETGEQRDSSRRMSCRLTYGRGAPLALFNYANQVTLTVGAR